MVSPSWVVTQKPTLVFTIIFIQVSNIKFKNSNEKNNHHLYVLHIATAVQAELKYNPYTNKFETTLPNSKLKI